MISAANSINNNLIPKFLIDPRFRKLRHFVLLLIIFVITSNLTIRGQYKTDYSMYYERLLFFIIFAGVMYTNMCVLVPRFLLQNKFTSYFALVFVCTSFLLLIICFSQIAFHLIDWNKGLNYTELFLNFSYFMLTFGLIVICSSSAAIFKRWVVYNQRISELETITLNAELQQLKNQINPHFLFNMLNNANIMVKHNPIIASEMLIKLDDLLCYQIEDSAKEKVFLKDDILFLASYLELEKSRRDRFEYIITKSENVENVVIPPLLFIPFVENAVKHSPESKNTSSIIISFQVENGRLIFTCINSKPKIPLVIKDGGLGLANIKRRLELLYGDNHSLIIDKTETIYSVNLELKL